jgi:membrane-associated progesterone receptor component
MLGHAWANAVPSAPHPSSGSAQASKKEDDEKEPPRNFTQKQLAYFDGKKDKDGNDKPVYLSLNRTVFDVSDGRNFYGPDGPYELFAGHECGIALAKMSFDTKYLDDFDGVNELRHGEKAELDGWIEKFTYYRCYPVLGRVIPDSELPSCERILTKEDLARHAGSQEKPQNYAAAPIYLGAGDKVFDVSFGGLLFYGPGGGYNRFAGKDASRALAKMSFEPEDTENTSVGDLTDKQRQVLTDWIKTFEEKKGYPIVGSLGKE